MSKLSGGKEFILYSNGIEVFDLVKDMQPLSYYSNNQKWSQCHVEAAGYRMGFGFFGEV